MVQSLIKKINGNVEIQVIFGKREKPYLFFGKIKNGLLIGPRDRPTLKPPKKSAEEILKQRSRNRTKPKPPSADQGCDAIKFVTILHVYNDQSCSNLATRDCSEKK